MSGDKLAEAFDDLGFELEAGKVTDRLSGLCALHGIDEDKLSCEYLAFLSRKKLPITRAPDLEILDDFDHDLAKHLQTKAAQKQHIENTVGGKFVSDEVMVDADEDDDDDGALSFYGKQNPAVKRQLTPETPRSNKRRPGSSQAEPDAPFSPSVLPPKTPGSAGGGGKFSNRTNSGKIMIRYGDDLPQSSKSWINSSEFSDADISVLNKDHPMNYRYMFERLRERAGHLDENICRIGDILIEKNKLEPQDFSLPLPQTFDSIGRICCDSEGRLNAKSILLQGSQDISRGRTIPFDTTQLGEFSLFPGQVVGVKGTNPTGNRLVTSQITYDASPPAPSCVDKPVDGLQIVVASGPYTTSDNLDYEPLQELLRYVVKNRPHVLIMCGPFVDVKHPKIESGNVDVSFDALFGKVMKAIADTLDELDTKAIIVSSARDAHHNFIYPTPSFPEAKTCDKIKMVPDPCIVKIEGIKFGITSTDALFHLGREEISFPPRSGDRLRRLAHHLIQQRSFYPLYPPNEDVNLDVEMWENAAQFDEVPDVLVLPSDLLHYFKDINGCLAMNPQRLSRGEGGGVFARLKINAIDSTKPVSKQISAEILRI